MSVQNKRKGKITFIWDKQPEAKKVYLAGEFNDWDPQARRMSRVKDRTFRATLDLGSGQYEYKFVVDGDWQNDPDAEGQTVNQYGTLNSVVCVA